MDAGGTDQALVLVLSLGVPAEGDVGVGAQAVLELERRFVLPEYVKIVRAENVDTDVLELMEEASFILAVDCVESKEAPGAIHRFALDEFERPGEPPESCHEQDLLAGLGVLEMLGGRPPAILMSMEIGEHEPRPDLSPAVATALPALVERLVEELVRVGVPVTSRL